jgi:quercetin dioxygenase-like cupin family protein
MAEPADQWGDIANRFLFENDRVRIWSLDLAPGEASAWHRHDRDYVIVVLESDGGVVAEEQGGEHVRRGMKPGDVAYRQRGEVHRAVNKGSGQYRNILIELK